MDFVQRLKDKVQRENLWFFILLLLLTKSRYGYELRRLVKDDFGFLSGNVTAYRVLYSLQSAGLVRSEMKDRRKYYSITEAGKREVAGARSFLEGLLKSSEGR